MAYWLVKSEPFKYSWDQFEKDGITFWDGVRNYAARNNLRAMKKGIRCFFTTATKALRSLVSRRWRREAYQDPTTEDEAWVAVDLKPYKKLKQPVSLKTIKADPRLKTMDLLRLGRLSVGAVTDDEYAIVMEYAKTKG
jgi:predicted RNA-binding protein with PUA-like domain